MGTRVAVAADDQAAGKAETQFRPYDMDDALPWLVDIEQPDAAGRGLDPQRCQQLLSDLDGSGPSMGGRNCVIGRRKRQFWVVDLRTPALEVEEASRTTQIVQQMAVDMEKIGIIAQSRDDMLVPILASMVRPELAKARLPLIFCRRTGLPVAALHGLLFRHQPERIKAY